MAALRFKHIRENFGPCHGIVHGTVRMRVSRTQRGIDLRTGSVHQDLSGQQTLILRFKTLMCSLHGTPDLPGPFGSLIMESL